MCSPTMEQPPIFWAYWHPHKTLLDIIVSWIFSFLIPLSCPPEKNELKHGSTKSTETETEQKDEQVEHAKKLRAPLDKMILAEANGKAGGYRKLASALDCDLVEVSLKVARQNELLSRWSIELPEDASLSPNQTVTVHLAFPDTILPGGIEKPTDSNEVGCLVLEDDNIIEKLSKDTPLIVFFHGGGMTMGNARMSEGLGLLHKVVEGKLKEDSDRAPAFLYASVEYSLAPEHAFPVPPLEACSVINCFIEAGFEQIHILGVSAGGAHALVSGIETYLGAAQKNKDAIRSVTALCPMLNPACDTLSYYQNSTSSHVVPVPWLKWCWRAYLGLPEPTGDEERDDQPLTVDGLLCQGSNRKAWKESKWFANQSIRRWAEPASDVPSLDGKGPKFIITTNGGDPLKDDGVAMVEALKRSGAKVSYHAHKGTHFLGTILDQEGYQRVANEWAKILFGR